jgi:DNA-binding response OmpR family regulator
VHGQRAGGDAGIVFFGYLVFMAERVDEQPQILIVCTDMIFSTKITGTAKALQKSFGVARSLERFEALLAVAAPAPLVIVDMSVTVLDAVAVIRAAKAHAGARVVAFLSHVEVEMAAAAREAGADEVMARSAFSARLPEIVGN